MNDLNKKTMDLKEVYKKETGLKVWTPAELDNEYYDNDYVEWLEAKNNYTPCCTTLKVKKTLNFRDWTEENNIGLDENGQWFINGKGDVDIDTLIDMHVRDVYL